MPAVGLDISETAVSAIELVRHKHGFVLGRFGQRALPPRSIEGGYVKDKEGVVRELRRLKDELKLDFVNASLPEEKAYLFRTTIPRVADKEIREAIEFKLEENVPIRAVDATFDYTLITETGYEGGDHLDVGVTAVPRKVVDTYRELVEAAGLFPLSFEITAEAVSRAVIAKGDRGTHLVVTIGARSTELFIVSEEVVHFTSTVAVGGTHITAAIAKHFSVSISEAESIKREHTAFRDTKAMDLFMSFMHVVGALKDEVSKLSLYWQMHKDANGEAGKKIDRVILCGKDAALAGFADYFSLALEGGAEVASVWQNAFSFEDSIPKIAYDESLDYAAAIGLAIQRFA